MRYSVFIFLVGLQFLCSYSSGMFRRISIDPENAGQFGIVCDVLEKDIDVLQFEIRYCVPEEMVPETVEWSLELRKDGITSALVPLRFATKKENKVFVTKFLVSKEFSNESLCTILLIEAGELKIRLGDWVDQ